jgi:hypothetical protein
VNVVAVVEIAVPVAAAAAAAFLLLPFCYQQWLVLKAMTFCD